MFAPSSELVRLDHPPARDPRPHCLAPEPSPSGQTNPISVSYPLAFLPIGRRREVPLSAARVAALSPQRERPYRTSARDQADETLLSLPRRSQHDDTILESRGQTVAVSSAHHYAVARIDVRVRGETALLTARCLPVPLSLLAWSALVLLASRGSPFLSAVAVLVPSALGISSFVRARAHVSSAMDEIASELGE